MKIKQKLTIIILMCCLCTGTFLHKVSATNFNNQEEKYIKLCASSKLSSSQQKTCKEFNTYLNKKNTQLKKEATQAKKDASKTKETLSDIESKLNEYSQKITQTQDEMNYLNKSIQNYNTQINDKNKILEDRLYTMQTTVNTQSFIHYLFGADSFSDFISRLSSLSEITRYDNELIEQLNDSLAEVEKQKGTLQHTKATLEEDLAIQKALQNKYTTLLKQQQNTASSNSEEVAANEESMAVIKANLAALQQAANESKVNNVTTATPNKKPAVSTNKPSQTTPSKPDNPSETNKPSQTNPSDSSTDKPSQTTPSKPDTPNETNKPTQTPSSNEELGLAIANKALSRQGYMYVWGGSHSWSAIKNPNQTQFDCSGLVNWAHYQAGVDLGRIHYTGSLISAGQYVERSQLQAGDIILFSSNGSSSGVHHVGIYIGNNQMVHAPTEGMPVQVAKLSTNYWQREWYTCRRLY